MRFIKIIVMLVGTVVVSGALALLLASGMASAGMLGTCFEGACGYAALFLAFPLLWLALLAAAAIGYGLHRRRARQR